MTRFPVAILAAVLAPAVPAGVAEIMVSNCSNGAIDVALRDGTSPSGTNRNQACDLAHRSSWTGECGTAISWAHIKLASGAAVYKQTADAVCVLALTGSDTQAAHPIAMRTC